MILKFFTKIYVLTLLLVLLVGCVNNKDQVTVKSSKEDPIELTNKTLAGTWEVYFFNKLIIRMSTNIQDKYRNTEYDGFTVTFKEDGNFYEKNVFGDVTREGKYLIGNYASDDTINIWKTGPLPDKKKDGIFMSYITEKEKVLRRPRAEIPLMYDGHFAFRDRYTGTIESGEGFKVEDIRYYRNVEKAPDYMPEAKEFQKNILNINDLLGRWEFYNYYIRINDVLYPGTSVGRDYGQQYLFKIVNGKQEFYEYIPIKNAQGVATGQMKQNRKGEFRIIDDVVNIATYYTDNETGEEVTESFKLWVKDEVGTDGGKRMIKSYDKYRDINDVLKEKEEFDFFRRLGDN